MELIKTFNEITKSDTAIAGGKGASLGEMTQADIPVPPGFVILSSAFEKFLEETDLNVEIDSLLHQVNHQKVHTVDRASEDIQALILRVEIPKDIVVAIQTEFKKLNSKYVAVRSSATAEDGSEHAWAGQLDSYLNTKENELIDKVKHCWASLFTPRAIFYRFEKGLHKTKISVAVVIQKMVNSEKSGIAFSVHPVTQDQSQLIIEAGYGLGEAIVSGSVTPNSYVVEKEPRRIIDKNITNQGRGLYRNPNGGNEWQSITEEMGNKSVLSDEHIEQLSDIILKIEKHYDFPCDIEWAFENGKFYITQSRPITTLINAELVSNSTKIINKIRAMKWEKWLERPFHAFTLSLFENSYRKENFEKIGLNGIDSRPQLFQQGFWYFNKEEMEKMDAQVGKYLESHGMIDITTALKNFKEKSEQKINELIKSKKPLEIKFAEIFDILTRACTFIWLAHGVESFYDRKLKEEVPKYYTGDIDKFIGDASFPRKKNTNAMLDALMRSDMSSAEIANKVGWVKVRDGFSDPFTAEEIEKMRKELPPVLEFTNVKIPKELEKLFEQVQELVFFRTERTDVFYQLYFQARPILKELAKKHGIEFKDMNYYRAKSFIDGKAEKYSPLCSFAFDGEDVLFQKDPIITEVILDKDDITGTIAFKGKVRGLVKIVKNPTELDKVKQGDILVTQMTFPSFIPAMNRASAFVTDEGGITCHAAIVAREMGKPCIIGTKNATKKLKDNDLVEVDANNGVVKILH